MKPAASTLLLFVSFSFAAAITACASSDKGSGQNYPGVGGASVSGNGGTAGTGNMPGAGRAAVGGAGSGGSGAAGANGGAPASAGAVQRLFMGSSVAPDSILPAVFR